MSRKTNITLDRMVVKSFLMLHYKDYKAFCIEEDINYNSFLTWLRGVDTMPAISRTVINKMKEKNYPIDEIIKSKSH